METHVPPSLETIRGIEATPVTMLGGVAEAVRGRLEADHTALRRQQAGGDIHFQDPMGGYTAPVPGSDTREGQATIQASTDHVLNRVRQSIRERQSTSTVRNRLN